MNLNLLKRVLTDTISPEMKEKFFSDSLTSEEIDLILKAPFDPNAGDGRINPESADTMIGIPRLTNIQHCIEQVIKNNVEGDLIETGVWRGGACIFMAACLKEHGDNRKVYVADSFEGLPKPDKKFPADKKDKHHKIEFLKVDLETVKDNFKKYGLLDSNIHFIKGFFSESFKEVPFKKLSILRLDGDMYSSTWDVLTSLYAKLSDGGFCIIDDYHLPACKKAVNDFRKQNNIEDEIVRIDWTGVYWVKNKINYMTIEQKYLEKCEIPSDINQLLPYLKRYADECRHVTELGVRQPTSTYALLASKAKVIVSYDIETQPEVAECIAICKKEKRDWKFIEADVLKIEIEETDFLWIDTFHTYSQLKAELKLHAKKARKYIGFHDTHTYGVNGEPPYLSQGHSGMNDGKGLLEAINEFLVENPEWKISMKVNRNNGLTVIERA